jgi:hypothetical protein
MTLLKESTVHVRFEGNSFDIPLMDLDLALGENDQSIKQSVANYLDISVDRLRHYLVDRHRTGNITIRPEAVFG